MFSRVEKTLSAVKLTHDQPLVVGVSGGADSLCLLHMMAQLSFPLVAAHLDHNLRPESAEDAEFVRNFAAKLDIPVRVKREDVAGYADEYNKSIEEAARELRYAFLFQQARETGAPAVLVAHHADDQVESVLMHLLRGAGLAGLRGMQAVTFNPQWHQEIPLVRPLLGVWREEIEGYCTEHHITPRFDRSNLDTTYFRNRLRHELIPALEEYNPRVRQTLWRTADTLASDYEALQSMLAQAWQDCEITSGVDHVRINRKALNQQLLGVKRGLVRQAINKLRPGLRDIDFEAVQGAIDFSVEPTSSGQADLIDGLKLEIDGEWLVIAEWHADRWQSDWPKLKRKHYLTIPGSIELSGGWKFEAEVLTYSHELFEQAQKNSDDFQAWLDGDAIDQPVFLRSMKAGDRFCPLGMATGSVKVGDFFTNEKLPPRARRHWPLVFDQIGVLWIPGYRIDHRLRLEETSRLVVHFRLYRN